MLDEISPFFKYGNCKFGNEKWKKNCARLGIYRDWDLQDSFTIESSCFGWVNKFNQSTIQFKELDFINFGRHLAYGVARFYKKELTDSDKAAMCIGVDLVLDHFLYDDMTESTKKKKKKNSKAGRKGENNEVVYAPKPKPKINDPEKAK